MAFIWSSFNKILHVNLKLELPLPVEMFLMEWKISLIVRALQLWVYFFVYFVHKSFLLSHFSTVM